MKEEREENTMYLVRKIYNPSMFQGKYKKRNYFEGWYYKLIDEKQDVIYSIIPGVAYGKTQEESHAFIQVIDGITGKTYYFYYPLEKFWYSTRDFDIRIGKNHFTEDHLSLCLSNPMISIDGELDFIHRVPYPKRWNAPGIMGPFSFVPGMECYHGVVNIHHEIRGSLWIDGEKKSFQKGYGYIEKDWGRSFPSEWIWIQSNHFTQNNVSFMFSIAPIPWFFTHFVGFLCFLKIREYMYCFSTYTGAKIKKLANQGERWHIIIEDKKYKLDIYAEQGEGGILKAPKNGEMSRKVKESINSKIKIFLLEKKTRKILFQDKGIKTGMEISGDLFAWNKKRTRKRF